MLLTSFRLRLSVVSFTRTIHFYEEQKKKRPACHNDCCVRHFVREHSANRTQNKVWKGTKKEEEKREKAPTYGQRGLKILLYAYM